MYIGCRFLTCFYCSSYKNSKSDRDILKVAIAIAFSIQIFYQQLQPSILVWVVFIF
ncbi:hypothetical protein HC931_03760 [Candidatus Gracilibacteria bacterium]|nr:hypothetical protein [Candidatus Gracilibacteria bacterium]NJM89792.1 hypothetical protein [Hydrococcus sp. RU_2_2]NJP18584.1 hypothetical protein [Hydrococcus sp. CRU_1_1]